MKKVFTEAYKEASKQLAKDLTKQLKSNARDDGWTRSVVRGLKVNYTDSVFSVESNPKHAKEMFDLEYSNKDGSPKGTIRRTENSTQGSLDKFAAIFERLVMKS